MKPTDYVLPITRGVADGWVNEVKAAKSPAAKIGVGAWGACSVIGHAVGEGAVQMSLAPIFLAAVGIEKLRAFAGRNVR